ncbi:peptidoglycan-binding protein [Streptomyces sp. NPDC094032]|uniref:peptidoglycan-binding domain-containing protein n=1 Tax=Streptomyces sp. NPDC094032 TaxID=3155308 RepID=UPI0033223B1B
MRKSSRLAAGTLISLGLGLVLGVTGTPLATATPTTAQAAPAAVSAPAPALSASPASSVYYTPAQATAKLRAAGITWRSSGGCSDKYTRGCTSFQGIRKTTIDGVVALKRASGSRIVITGAAEVPPHTTRGTYTHGKGYKVDVALDARLNRYITSHARRISSTRWAAGDVVYFKESNHWDITYKGGRTGPATPANRAWPTLRPGSQGQAVSTAQRLLRASGARIGVDGRYGPATAQAVKVFQRAHRLTADGVLGAATWQRLAPTLRAGANGEAVKALQEQLRRHGARIAADGRYSAGTTAAVRAFQRGHGLTADGVTGPTTWNRLVA